MKIYYIGDFSNEHTTESYIAQTLKKLDQDIIKVQEGNIKEEDIKKQLDIYQPDLLFFAKGKIIGGVDSLERVIKSFNGKKSFWLFDVMYDFPLEPSREEWMNRIGPLVDHAFVTDKSAVGFYKKAGINYHILRQGFMQDQFFETKKNKEMSKFEIGFVGSVYEKSRRDLIDFVSHNFKFILRGDKDMYELRGKDMCEFCQNVPIILGDSFGNRAGCWSNRIYNMIGSGGFFLGPYIEGINEDFTDGTHFVSYEKGNFNQLREIISFYLRDSSKRKEISSQGKHHVLTKHTYETRCKNLLEMISH